MKMIQASLLVVLTSSLTLPVALAKDLGAAECGKIKSDLVSTLRESEVLQRQILAKKAYQQDLQKVEIASNSSIDEIQERNRKISELSDEIRNLQKSKQKLDSKSESASAKLASCSMTALEMQPGNIERISLPLISTEAVKAPSGSASIDSGSASASGHAGEAR